MTDYYKHKREILERIFGTVDINIGESDLIVGDHTYPIVDDVILLCPPSYYTETVLRKTRDTIPNSASTSHGFSSDIQYSFGEEWKRFHGILQDDKDRFQQYFDIVDIDSMVRGSVICDLGCGNGRWSHQIIQDCKYAILVDFSDAIFVARRNLANHDNALFFMCDIQNLPFVDDFSDFLMCIGVLHHLPSPCLTEVRRLSNYASLLYIYLYYAAENRPFYFRMILFWVTAIRSMFSRIRSKQLREFITTLILFLVYKPLIGLGTVLNCIGMSRYVPLYNEYCEKSNASLRQCIYDRFFTRIEQRVSHDEIESLSDTFSDIIISSDLPYWHFLCKR